ncbi:unnamed protein product, partial [Chrysoparadoxa australica]
PLLGLPVAVKDNLCTAEVPTTAASKILQGYVPSYDATAVARMKDAGAIIIGKTNMDEYAMGSTTETSAYQVTRNPRGLGHAPGGSSGGSAAAVASGSVYASLGTDTGGSIRQPASWCGVVGLKPSYGRVSRKGLIAYASSTDCVGPITTTVMDSAALLSVLAGSDSNDSTCLTNAVPDYTALLQACDFSGGKPLSGIRVGLIKEAVAFNVGGVEKDVADAVTQATQVLATLGADIVEVSLPKLPEQCAAYYVNVLSEASANLARFDGIRYGYRQPSASSSSEVMLGSRHDGLGTEVKQRIILGAFALSVGYSDAYYKKALAIRASLQSDFAEAFASCDVMVCPTSPTTAYRLGDLQAKGVKSYADDLYTVPASLAGLPALSLPCGIDGQGLPVGLQIIGAAATGGLTL